MTHAGKTLVYFGAYVLITGLIVLASPATFVQLLKLPEIPVGWGRVIGLLVCVIGCYDVLIGRNDIVVLMRASVFLRFFFAAGVVALIATREMNLAALPLGVIDALTALWTMWALKRDDVRKHGIA